MIFFYLLLIAIGTWTAFSLRLVSVSSRDKGSLTKILRCSFRRQKQHYCDCNMVSEVVGRGKKPQLPLEMSLTWKRYTLLTSRREKNLNLHVSLTHSLINAAKRNHFVDHFVNHSQKSLVKLSSPTRGLEKQFSPSFLGGTPDKPFANDPASSRPRLDFAVNFLRRGRPLGWRPADVISLSSSCSY